MGFRMRKLVPKRTVNQPVSCAFAAGFQRSFPHAFPACVNAPLVSYIYCPTETCLETNLPFTTFPQSETQGKLAFITIGDCQIIRIM